MVAVTIRHLLTHSSGLPAWRPLYQEADSRATALWVVNTTPLATTPGQAYVYSDLGEIVLPEVVERITREPLDRFLQERVFRPLGMPATRYLPPTRWRERIAPTENDTSYRDRKSTRLNSSHSQISYAVFCLKKKKKKKDIVVRRHKKEKETRRSGSLSGIVSRVKHDQRYERKLIVSTHATSYR